MQLSVFDNVFFDDVYFDGTIRGPLQVVLNSACNIAVSSFNAISPINVQTILNLGDINAGCVMANPIIYDHTVGAKLEIHVADVIVDIESIELKVKKPLNKHSVWTPDSYIAGAELVIHYTIAAGDIDVPGVYHIQPIVTMTNGEVWPLGVICWTVHAQCEDA